MSKKWIYPVGLIIAAFLAFYMYQKFRVAPSIKLNELNLSNLKGEDVSFETFKGKKIVLSFGASWCGNCREELDLLTAIKDRDLSDVEIIVISDEPLEKIIRFKEKRGYPFTFLKMDKPFHEIGINSIPTTYIINTKLEIKQETVGYLNWEDPSNLQYLKKLME
jgi:peroxiredoxin